MEYGIDDKYMKELRDILASVPEIEEAVLYGSRRLQTRIRHRPDPQRREAWAGAVGAPSRQALPLPPALFRRYQHLFTAQEPAVHQQHPSRWYRHLPTQPWKDKICTIAIDRHVSNNWLTRGEQLAGT